MDKKQTRTVIAALASPIALIATGALVYQASFAAFTATTQNTGNSWSTTSEITLSNNKSAALFANVTGVTSTYNEAKCIEVTANAGVASSVRLFAEAPATANGADLASNLAVSVVEVPATAAASDSACTSAEAGASVVAATPISTLLTGRATWDSATAGVWTPTVSAEDKKVYRVNVKFKAGVTQVELNESQGETAGFGLVWERRTS